MQVLFDCIKSSFAQVEQVVESLQVAQLEVQAKHFALLRYLPSMQPAAQVVAFRRYPSTHPPHKSIVGPVQVVQAELQSSQVPV